MAVDLSLFPAASKRRRKRPIARAVHKFVGVSEEELSFSPGESILLIKRVDENWLEGELDGRIGIFPKNRVKVEVGSPSLSSESALARSGRACAVALNDFPGDCPGDLPLLQGQIVELLGNIGSGWSRGKIDESIGIFPTSFVEILQPLARGHYKIKEEEGVAKEEGGAKEGDDNGLMKEEGGASDSVVIKPIPKPRSVRPVPKPRAGTATLPRSFKPSSEAIDSGRGLSNGLHPLPRFSNISEYEEQLLGLQSSLETEEKMIQSAQRLLKVCQSEEKREKLEKTLENRQNKVDEINEQINLLEFHRADIIADHQIRSAPATPPIPRSITTPPKDPSDQRERVTNELINTEQEYHKELTAFCSKVLPAFKQWREVPWSELFSNLEEVVLVSGKMVTGLLADKRESLDVGALFKELAPELRDKYGVYCRNHDHASQLLEKLYEDKETVMKIKTMMDLGKPEVTSWDLHTFLIKPVQRVLKYPLLLGKLLEYMPPDDSRHKILMSSLKLSSQVAQDINEIKRRKDLLDRYTGSGRDERRLNLGTMRKKVRRFRQTITQKTGLRSATIDGEYSNQENIVMNIEGAVRSLINNINGFIEEGENYISHRESLTEYMSDFSGQSESLNKEKRHFEEMKKKWKNHVSVLRNEVLGSLSVLLGLFNDPLLLMNKRRDKLLDYDSLQYDMERCSEPDKLQQLREDVTLAKRTYEALNTQLIEDLPLFSDKALQGLRLILVSYLEKSLSFHENMSAILSGGQEEAAATTEEDIMRVHKEELKDLLENLCTLSVIPSSLSLSFGIVVTSNRSPRLPSSRLTDDVLLRKPIKGRRVSMPSSLRGALNRRSQSPIYEEISDDVKASVLSKSVSVDLLSPPSVNEYDLPPLEDDDVTTPTNNETTPIDGEATPTRTETPDYEIPPDALLLTPPISPSPPPLSPEDSPPPAGSVLIVLYDFVAESDLEISVSAGDCVKLIAPNDTDGCDQWWLVEVPSTGGRGYVPFNFFEISN
ncbi:PREDICTED: rho guanine nucleotide exchange factor 37-like [Amphimedon queenslandica]|uniref:Dynamin-binding protein n=1 Tax=Amphimedon queenslandica TaxID=400682 RepID=A0A1X7UZP8_AMPQE|nr:PREDICTED: rho guanine nucleotide exchange factor 37-like [Amphimedon queenslandica]|eukprot:XP_019851340.1 PREDICTED: rho guanine nucleotide exchange factor 37-like [Amphimedon queenslandica]